MQSCKLSNKVIALTDYYSFLNSSHGSCYAGALYTRRENVGRLRRKHFDDLQNLSGWIQLFYGSFPSLLEPFTLVLYISFNEEKIFMYYALFLHDTLLNLSMTLSWISWFVTDMASLMSRNSIVHLI